MYITEFCVKPGAVIGKIFWHNNQLRSVCLQVRPVTCRHPPVLVYKIGVYSMNSSKMIADFPAEVLVNFNRLFPKLNRFISN